MLRRLCFVSISCLFILFSLPVAFAQIEEEVRVDLIEIWAKVTDKGNRVVSDLRPDEFRVYIDGKEMPVRCFDKVFEDPFGFAKQEAALETENDDDNEPLKRKFIFFFDLLNTNPRSVDFLKRELAEFLRQSFREEDQGMVFALLPNMHLGVVQKMTDNKEALMDVINKMRGNATLESRVRNNEKELLDVLTFGSNLVRESTERGTGITSRAPEQIRQARGLARTYAAQEENLSKYTLGSFLSIAEYLSGNHFEGRLVMIYLSGGFALRPGQNYYEIVDRAIEDTQVVGNEDLAFRDRPTEDFEQEVRKTIGILNRLNVTIYSVDAKGLLTNDRGPERDSRQLALGFNTINYQKELQDSLVMIARETGGTAFTNSQNYQLALADISSDMNQQYWLCANVPANKKKGVYHKIEVKTSRPDVKVRHRMGYIE